MINAGERDAKSLGLLSRQGRDVRLYEGWIGEEKEDASRVLGEHRLEDLNIIGASIIGGASPKSKASSSLSLLLKGPYLLKRPPDG